jgi:WhiB family transcriptional regulator, redox-sensing transcriptional regulator
MLVEGLQLRCSTGQNPIDVISPVLLRDLGSAGRDEHRHSRSNWNETVSAEQGTSGSVTVTTEEPMYASAEETDERSWQNYANCLGVDPDLFFPERGASTREAKEVCRGCVVREDCLEYALRNGEKFGIWGGMSERERRRIRRQRSIARQAVNDKLA